MQHIKILKLHPSARIPTKAHKTDACFDLYTVNDYSIVIPANSTEKIGTGIAVVIPEGYDIDIKERSGLALKELSVGGGIIDQTYSGEICVIIRNNSDKEIILSPGSKIAQFRLVSRIPTLLEEINKEEFNKLHESSERKENGFGSTG